jgi:hypothetical protein
MPEYNLGKIYKIVCNNTGLIYIGSTCEPTLAKRLAKHKVSYNAWLNGKYGYTTSYEIIKNCNCSIILIENYPCNNKDELRSRERYYIENNKCVNLDIPVRSAEENDNRYKLYYAKNKEKISDDHKQYYVENKVKINEKHKLWADNNRDKMREISRASYHRNKDKNKDVIRERDKIRYEKNKSKILENKSQRYICICGSSIRWDGKSGHEKSAKHCKHIAGSGIVV